MRRVLIIEDDETQAAMLMRLLRQERILVAHAMTVEEGIQRDEKEDFDCVILAAAGMETICRIGEFRHPVVACVPKESDPSLISDVRATGASVVVKPGADLLVEKVWSQMNFRSGAIDSQLGQQDAQRRLTEPPEPISSETKVSFGIGQLISVILSVVAAALFVASKTNEVGNSVKELKITYDANSGVITKRLSDIETAVKENTENDKTRDKETAGRLADWNPWRWTVTLDLQRLGNATKTPIETKQKQ